MNTFGLFLHKIALIYPNLELWDKEEYILNIFLSTELPSWQQELFQLSNTIRDIKLLDTNNHIAENEIISKVL